MSRPGGPSYKPTSGLAPVTFSKLYTYATGSERAMVGFSCVAACASGSILPLFSLIFGKALNILNDPTASIVEAITELSLYFFLIAIGAGMLTFLEVSLVTLSTERQLRKLREAYIDALLHLDAAWFDTHRAGEAVTRLADATITVGSGMEKVPSVLRYTATLICGLAIGFSTSWKLSLVICACAPLFAIALTILIITAISSEKAERNAYARAGDAASEGISLIRNVAAYGGEKHEASRYLQFLRAAERAGIRKGFGIGTAVGLMLFSFYAMYGISTWAGAQFVIQSREENSLCRFNPTADGCFSGGQIITCFVSVLLGALSFGQIGPLMGSIAAARAAAADLYGVVDTKPSVNLRKLDGFTGAKTTAAAADNDNDATKTVDHNQVSGVKIEFRNVSFAYPSRADVQILKGFHLTINKGENVGIAGASGSGKSTLALLLMRAYDPQEGQVLVDDVDVKDWNPLALRSTIGLVSQDPVLFGVSIADNIAMGKPSSATDSSSSSAADTTTSKKGKKATLDVTASTLYSTRATREEIIEAAKSANAHQFISALPNGYDTLAGTGVSGSQLSGGQRQRICVARSLIRNPRMLLLDEATSALDTASERIVQAALDALSSNVGGVRRRTTLQVAHRLSTLLKTDRIIVMKGGMIVEEGTPQTLLNTPGSMFREMKLKQDVSDPGAAAAATTNHSSAAAAAHDPTSATEAHPHEETVVAVTATTTPSDAAPSAAAAASSASGDLTLRAVKPTSSSSPSIQQLPEISVRSRLWELQKEDAPIWVLGALGAMASGCIQPVVSIIYGNIIAIFFIPSDETMKEESLHYLGWFFLLGACAVMGVLCRVSVFTYLGERLTRKLRDLSYIAILRQPAAFFDNSENSVGRLGTRLATDAALVKGASGDALGSALEGGGAIICAVVIAFIASWRLALVLMIVFPFLILGSIFEFKSVAQSSKGNTKALEDAGNTVSEAVTAIRTVTAYNLQAPTIRLFADALETPLKIGIQRGLVQGSGQAFQRFCLMCAYALAFYSGARFINEGTLEFPQLIRTFLAVTLAAEAVGRISSQAPDSAKADVAARSIFHLIDSGNASPIDPLQGEMITLGNTSTHTNAMLSSPKSASSSSSSSSSSTSNVIVAVENENDANFPKKKGKTSSTTKGGVKIEFRNVSFAYPTRPDTLVLKNFNLVIQPGETIGIVGASGSGKSTLSLLVMRAYDPQEGQVLVDDVDVKEWNVASLRSTMGLVQQEPALFADSIAYNIAYGAPGPVKMPPGLGVQPLETGDDSKMQRKKKEGDSVSGTTTKKEGEDDDKEGGKDTATTAAAATATKKAKVASDTTTTAIDVKITYPPPPVEVAEAAASANAASFISALPDGYASFCGSRGSQLSGGQKQRIAISRALLRNPRCLLLDEATSALDSESERIVQAALDAVLAEGKRRAKALKNAEDKTGGNNDNTDETSKAITSTEEGEIPRTCMVIAHRLSTLANSDRIVVLEKGKIVESGSHSMLMSLPEGKYRTLAMSQQTGH